MLPVRKIKVLDVPHTYSTLIAMNQSQLSTIATSMLSKALVGESGASNSSKLMVSSTSASPNSEVGCRMIKDYANELMIKDYASNWSLAIHHILGQQLTP